MPATTNVTEIPSPGAPPPPPPRAPRFARCANHIPPDALHYCADNLPEWFDVRDVRTDVLLNLSQVSDPHLAHTALRHLRALPLYAHAVHVLMPPELHRHPAFQPWFQGSRVVSTSYAAHDRTDSPRHGVYRVFQSCEQHLSQPSGPQHAASFDIRLGGRAVRALFDTGATCSCDTRELVRSLGMSLQPFRGPSVQGIGGCAAVAGTVTLPVKIGKSHHQQDFLVLEQQPGAYPALLGQDYMHQVSCALRFTPDSVSLEVGPDPSQLVARVTRSLHHDVRAMFQYSKLGLAASDVRVVPVAYQISPAALSCGEDTHDELITSRAAYKRTMRDIRRLRTPAYVLSCFELLSSADERPTVPACVQRVIDRHAGADGALRGDVPYGVTAKGFNMSIQIEPGVRPVSIRQYRLTPAEREALVAKVDEFVRRGWIEPSASPWSSSVLFVPKPNGSLRFCVDYRFLNKVTVKDKGPLPDIQELLQNMQGANIYSALDLCSGFYQIPLAQESRDCTAFPTPFGQYRWRVMPMGLCNAPSVFQHAMNTVLRPHITAGYCLVYLDDVLIKSNGADEHAAHLDAVLSSLREYSFYCQLPKCQFALQRLRYLGHLVDGTGVCPDPKKVACLDTWRPPLGLISRLTDPASCARAQNAARKDLVSRVRSFLGFMTYFNRFIPRFAAIAAPLYEQTGNTPPCWDARCTDAWEALKRCLASATLMYHPCFDRPFHVYSDASLRGIGGVVLQQHDDNMQPVAFCARKLQGPETRYTVTEQELLAIVYCFQQWRCYLEGTSVFLHTDHEPLTWLQSQKSLNRRQAHWLEFMSRFTYTLLYVKGDENVVADALSRRLGLDDAAPLPLPGDTWPAPPAPAHTVAYFAHPADNVASRVTSPDVSGARGVFTRCLLTASRRLGVAFGASRCAAGDSGEGHTVLALAPSLAHACTGATWDVFATTRRAGEAAATGRRTGAPTPPLASSGTPPRVRSGGWCQAGARPVQDDAPPAPAPSGAGAMSPADLLDAQAEHLAAHEKLFDELYTRLREALRHDTATATDAQRTALGLREEHGLLWRYPCRVYVPPHGNLRQDVLWWHHDVPWAGHLGVHKTLQLVKTQFYWPGMRQDVEAYVSSCHACQRDKPVRAGHTPSLSPLVPPDSCWRTVGVDLVVDLPTSRSGHNAVCVFVCHLSKMVRLIPTVTTLDAEGFARLFVIHVFPHYGFPLRFVSDRDPRWNSEFFKALCAAAGVELRTSTAYHPQTNGLVERTNEVVGTALRHYVAADMTDWDDYLPMVEFALNNSYHEAIQSTPFRMNRVSLPLNPFDALVRNAQPLSTELGAWMGASRVDAGRRTYAQAMEEFQRARRCVHHAKARMKELHDRHAGGAPLYEIGQWVWLSARNMSLRHPCMRRKLLPKYWGPFEIVALKGNNAVELALPAHMAIHPVVSVSQIKLYKQRAGAPPAAVVIDGEPEWEVDAIIDHRVITFNTLNKPPVVEFRAKWKGPYHDSWHEPDDFEHAADVLEAYLKSLAPRARAKAIRCFDAASLRRLKPDLRRLARSSEPDGGDETALCLRPSARQRVDVRPAPIRWCSPPPGGARASCAPTPPRCAGATF